MGLTEAHAKWLEDRALSIEIATSPVCGLESRGPHIAIPYVVGGKKLYDKLRDPRDKRNTRCVPAGIDQTELWGIDTLTEEEPGPSDVLVITEGEFDRIAVLEGGYQFVASLPSGAANSAEACMSKARRVFCTERPTPKGPAFVLKPVFEKFRRVVVATDGDLDGRLMRDAIVEIFGDEFCWLPEYPDGAKDANEVKEKHGVQGITKLIDGAKPVFDDGFVDFITAEKETKPLRPLSCGIPFLNDHFRPIVPSLIVIGGQAGHGKSTIVQSIVFNLLWANSHLKGSLFHAEGDKTIPVQRSKKFWRSKQQGMTHFTEGLKAERDRWIADRLAYLKPPANSLPTFEWLIRSMEFQARHRGRNVFVIDPWNQIALQIPSRTNKTDFIGEKIYELKRLSDELKLMVIVAHHTTKAIDPREPPNRYSLADSAHWVNAADHLLLAWKPDEGENCTRLEVAKSKDHEVMGVPGFKWVGVSGSDFAIRETLPPPRYRNAAQIEQASRGAGGAQVDDQLIAEDAA